MKNHPFISRFLLIVPMLLLLLNIGMAQSASTKPITQKGLTDALKIGGLDSGDLIEAIKTRGVDFVLTPQIEANLRAAGASDKVISAVRGNYRGAASGPSAPPAPVQYTAPVVVNTVRTSPSGGGVFFMRGSQWASLPVESITWSGAGLMRDIHIASGGLLNEQITGNIAGTHSIVSVHAPASFLLRLPGGASVASYMLVHLHGKKDNRDFKTGFAGLKSSDEVAFQASASDGGYQITFTQGSGDYAFVLRNDIPKDKGTENPSKALTFRVQE